MNDPYDLGRFLSAQAPMYAQVVSELGAGRKHGHWIWFIFPQMKGLGSSPQSQFYGIGSLAEAEAYLAHPVLGPRLRECTRLVLACRGRSLADVLGFPDDLKFRSSMTLFAAAAPAAAEPLFREALTAFCGGEPDPATLALLCRKSL
ncbi:MAG: DUF1810 domain-containing protein [Terracidiphilus sp.]